MPLYPPPSAAGGGDALTTNPLSQFAATTSLQLKGVLSDETGSGAVAFATSPTLVTPILGVPTSGTLTNCTIPTAAVSDLGTGVGTFLVTPSGANLASALTTALPATKGGTGLTSLGTGVATSLGVNNNAAGGYAPIDGTATLTNKTINGAIYDRLKGTAGSYTVTMNGANTASVKTAVGSDIGGLITLTMSSTGNTSASICTISGFNFVSTPTIILVPAGTNAWTAQATTKVVAVASVGTTSFDINGGTAGLANGTSYTFNWIAVQ